MKVYGLDTETCDGAPITFQVTCGEYSRIVFLPLGASPSEIFLRILRDLGFHKRGDDVVMFAHNLEFDLLSLFYDRVHDFVNEEFDFSIGDWHISGVYANVVFARLKYGERGRIVNILDTFAWYKTSLKKLGAVFCPHLPKLQAPDDLGTVRYKKSDADFVAYATRDAEIAEKIGEFIMAEHAKYDVSLSVSAPHMASKIFRRKYLQKTIPLPPRKIVYSALHSYHGGKNLLTVNPGWHAGINVGDITSAYPYAMAQLPDLSELSRYKTIEGCGHIKSVPEFGIYRVVGVVKKCRWPSLYGHDFKPASGDVRLWTTGPELNEAIATGEIKISDLQGYYYDINSSEKYSPFRAYVDDFFRGKDQATSEVDRQFHKIMLNACYGKFIQARRNIECTRFDMEKNTFQEIVALEAGGLFNPFVASYITGKVRAMLHRLEHEYTSIHSATDSVFTEKKIKEIPGLGGFKLETSGDVVIARNKCYLIYGDIGENVGKGWPSKIYKGKRILKWALHGFHGGVFKLEHLLATGMRSYEYTKCNKLKESLRRGLVVNKFEKRKAFLILEGEK